MNNFKDLTQKQLILISLVWLVASIVLFRCISPFRAEWYYREGYNFKARKMLKDAAKSLEKSNKLAPLETFYSVTLGKIYEDVAREAMKKKETDQAYIWLKKAENTYERIIAISPRNPWYHNRLSEVYRLYAQLETDAEAKKKLVEASNDKIRKAASLDVNNGLFQMSLAYLYHRQGDQEKAMATYERVIEIEPKFVEAYFNMADIWRQRKRTDKTIELYKKIIEVKPSFKNVRLSLGRIYFSQGKIEEAKAEFIAEIKANKKNVQAYHSLGMVLMREQNWDLASKIFARIIYLKPNDHAARQNLSQCYYALGKINEAIDNLAIVLAANPKNAELQRRMTLLKKIKNRPKAGAAAKKSTKVIKAAETAETTEATKTTETKVK